MGSVANTRRGMKQLENLNYNESNALERKVCSKGVGEDKRVILGRRRRNETTRRGIGYLSNLLKADPIRDVHGFPEPVVRSIKLNTTSGRQNRTPQAGRFGVKHSLICSGFPGLPIVFRTKNNTLLKILKLLQHCN